ncbi:MAG: hypothetical protein M3N07_03120 [Pseudomonadota bacterium]|nr:hypothetical protein [Pseudomonadota bacterium]
MKRQGLLAAAALAALLPGCERDAPALDPQPKVKIRNEPHEALQRLPDNLRRIGLMRAIRDTGNNCPLRVESSAYQGEHEGLAMWTARCDDNRQWAIFLAPNGDVQVRNCADMAQLGLPACRELPPAPQQQRRTKSGS